MFPHEFALIKDGYLLTHEELLRVRSLKILTSDRDYIFFALRIDYPSVLNPAIEVTTFCERWKLDEGDLYKALGDLQKKGIVVSISSQLNLQLS